VRNVAAAIDCLECERCLAVGGDEEEDDIRLALVEHVGISSESCGDAESFADFVQGVTRVTEGTDLPSIVESLDGGEIASGTGCFSGSNAYDCDSEFGHLADPMQVVMGLAL
tara:strand:- start:1025 stop:1360 length:336 start_codon:yes stop_codon:yes gene_type:complete